MKDNFEFKLLQFSNNYIESYFEDGSKLALRNNIIHYFSISGTKLIINMKDVSKVDGLKNKINRILRKINRFNDAYVETGWERNSEDNLKYKKYQIKNFSFETAKVKQNGKDFEITSDDFNATTTLMSNLYIIKIKYFQKTGQRKATTGDYQGRNMTKILLQKYGEKYTEFPQNKYESEMQYEYLEIEKVFTIFNLPQRWYAPIFKIWEYILSNELITNKFCYIDFSEEQKLEYTESKMPPIKKLIQPQEEEEFQQFNIPIYGKPNHKNPLSWLYIQSQNRQIIGFITEHIKILWDEIGFWFVDNGNIDYKKINQSKKEFECKLKVFPYMIRFQNQPQRNIKSHLIPYHAYTVHSTLHETKEEEPQHQPTNITLDNQIYTEQTPHETHKAYQNGLLITKFTDKTILSLNGPNINLITPLAKTYSFNLNNLEYYVKSIYEEFKGHIQCSSNIYQKVYFPQEYAKRMEMNQDLQWVIRNNNANIQVCRIYGK